MTNNIADEVMEAFYENFDGFCGEMYNECLATALRKLADYARDGCGMLHACELIDIADKLGAQTYD
jgi:hypothetical protein